MRGYRADRAFDGERVLPGGALVLVDGERIVAVQPAGASAPADVPVTALPGTTLLPGLVDAHVHLCGDDGPRALDQLPELTARQVDRIVATGLQRQLAAGVTTVRDLGDTTGRSSTGRRGPDPPWWLPGRRSRRRAGTAGRWAAQRAEPVRCGPPSASAPSAARVW